MGAMVSAETCPQYLMLDSSAVERFGGVAKIAPPLREPADSEALWDGLGDGTLSVVASDHAPFLLHEKADVPFSVAPQGLPDRRIARARSCSMRRPGDGCHSSSRFR
jgi:dihydroorotase-like cyclic amidohydrolase